LALPGLDAKVRAHTRMVDDALARMLPEVGVDDPDVRGPMRHVVAAGGKRIRPALCLLAHEAVGGKPQDALPTAVGIELLHTFTLVHDDIMDKASLRRARPTVGALWGTDIAITVGDALFALAFESFTSNAEVPGMDPARVLAVVRRAARVSADLAQGQTLDLLQSRRRDVSVEEYLEMVRLKTGVLLEFSLAAGAMLGGADAQLVAALSAFGAPLGAAFQIRDDLLDITGDPAKLGKPLGGDVRTGKRTLMVAHAFAHSPRASRLAEILDQAADHTRDDDVREAIAILEAAGSIAFARAVAERRLTEAKSALERVPGRPRELVALAGLADYVLRREE
jgi:geranylgeranyl pyrophosphate synthase